jgi:hypothetical protein
LNDDITITIIHLSIVNIINIFTIIFIYYIIANNRIITKYFNILRIL